MATRMLRYAEKAVSLDGAVTVTFPLMMYLWQSSGPLRSAYTRAPGNNYGFDHFRNAISPRDIARETIAFMVGEDDIQDTIDQIDEIKGAMLNMGAFWLTSLGQDGTRRKARCRLNSMPDVQVSYKRSITAPVVIEMDRMSDWYGETLVTPDVEVVTSSPDTFTITNPGNIPVDLVEIRLRSNGATGFTNPHLENLTNGYELRSTRDAASANSELKLDTSIPSILWSTDDGGTYADDWALYVQPTLQLPLSFRLDPGPNSIRYTDAGTPNVNISFSFYAAFANG